MDDSIKTSWCTGIKVVNKLVKGRSSRSAFNGWTKVWVYRESPDRKGPIFLSHHYIWVDSDWWDRNSIETSEGRGCFIPRIFQITEIQLWHKRFESLCAWWLCKRGCRFHFCSPPLIVIRRILYVLRNKWKTCWWADYYQELPSNL